jgi:riboflavin synthase
MFTGIIESIGVVKQVSSSGSNKTFWIESPISSAFRIDQSVCHDGVCLTVEEIKENMHRVTAIKETLKKTTLGSWKTGTQVNLERSMLLNERLDGHIVQGHADSVATCLSKINKNGSWEFQFEVPKKFGGLIIEKGSICLNGVSLTIFDVRRRTFKVAIIPYTFENTNIKTIIPGEKANVEFDLIGKYVNRFFNMK